MVRGLTRIGGLAKGFNEGYDTVGKIAQEHALQKIAKEQPEQVSTFTETNAPDPEDMTYDSDTGQYVPSLKAIQAGLGDAAPVLPKFDAETTTRFLGQSYEQPLTTAEQAYLRNEAAADIIARHDPAAAARMRVVGSEAKRLAREDVDQQIVRRAWDAPDEATAAAMPVRGLQRIEIEPSAAAAVRSSVDPLGSGDAAPAMSPDMPSRGNVAAADMRVRMTEGRDSASSYYRRKAPAVIDAYLRAGKVDEAKRLRDFLDSSDGQDYTRLWSAGVRRLAAGDYHGSLAAFERLYNDQAFPDDNIVKLSPVADGARYRADFFSPSGKLLHSATKPIADLAKQAGTALAPEKMAEFMARSEEQRNRESALLDRQLELERMRQDGQQYREDRRDERLGMRLDANAAALEKRLAAGPARGALTPAQERGNAEIDAARERVAGMDPAEVRRRTLKTTETGRENPDFDPGLARAASLAARRKIGSDDWFDARQAHSNQPPQSASVQSRFAADRTMAGMRLGRQTDKGIEVFDRSGKHIGYYR